MDANEWRTPCPHGLTGEAKVWCLDCEDDAFRARRQAESAPMEGSVKLPANSRRSDLDGQRRDGETEGKWTERGGWRRGVLDAAEFLRRTWDDGDQGNCNDAAELVLLREFAESRSPPPSDRQEPTEELPAGVAQAILAFGNAQFDMGDAESFEEIDASYAAVQKSRAALESAILAALKARRGDK